jgi:hypothetical protein
MTRHQIIEVNFKAFFSAGEKPLEFQGLLHETLRQRASIRATISVDTVRLEVCNHAKSTPKVQLRGDWCDANFRVYKFDCVSSKLFLPYLFNISEVSLFYDQILTLGHSYRPLSDFFMRNLLYSFSRDETFACYASGNYKTNEGSVTNLTRQYFFIFQSMFPEPSLEGRQAGVVIDLITANAYLPLLEFNNPLLNTGARKLQELSVAETNLPPIEQLVGDLNDARLKVLEHFS